MEYALLIARKRNSVYGKIKVQLYNNITSNMWKLHFLQKATFLEIHQKEAYLGIHNCHHNKKKIIQYAVCK